jgi:hypothetical protein
MKEPQTMRHAPERLRRAPVSPNLVGEPCSHTFVPYRGFMMCSQPLCAALCNRDGTWLSGEEMHALIAQLRREGLDV